MTDHIDTTAIFTQPIDAPWLRKHNCSLHVLRLDAMHPIISGNKWFKIKNYLNAARAAGADTIATFGGAYSNHIVALACACKLQGLKSIGMIRGEAPGNYSQTLQDAVHYGMQLQFVSREAYKNKEALQRQLPGVFWINEGGYGIAGAAGAADIVSFCSNPLQYSHIVCAAGTGTMMAGIVHAASLHQTIIGVSVMKGNNTLENEINALLSAGDKQKNYRLVHDFHFGGYAKHPPQLVGFINETWQQHQLPTDIVYTSKTFYAIQQMVLSHTIAPGSNVLMIHSGGLQGNRSLPANTLSF